MYILFIKIKIFSVKIGKKFIFTISTFFGKRKESIFGILKKRRRKLYLFNVIFILFCCLIYNDSFKCSCMLLPVIFLDLGCQNKKYNILIMIFSCHLQKRVIIE